MGATPSEYDAVIADLEAQLFEIQTTVDVLKRRRDSVLGPNAPAPQDPQGGTRLAAPTASGIPRTPVPASDAFFGMSIVDAVKKYLGMVRRPVGTRLLVTMLQQGGFRSESKDFYGTLFSVLRRRAITEGDIVKVGSSEWGLAEWYPNLRRKVKRDEPGMPTVDLNDEEAEEGKEEVG